MRSRSALVLSWVGVTLGLTVMAWLAVGVVANQVGGSGSTVLTEAQVTALLADAPSASPSRASASPTPRTSSSAGATSSTKPQPTPTNTKSSSPQPTHSANPGDTASTKSFSTVGGVVAATCRAATVSLQSARPADGWTVEVKDRGPERVEVRFENDHGDRTEVRVSCTQGDPVQDSSGGSEGGSG